MVHKASQKARRQGGSTEKKRNVSQVEAIWKGEQVFVIGGGPSLKGIDLDRILKGYRVIGVNDAYLFDCADICFFGDELWYRHHGQALKQWGNPVYSSSGVFDTEINFLGIKGVGVSQEPNKVGWNSCSGWAAMNLALHLGARQTFLLGYDMDFGSDGESNWHPNIRKVNRNSYSVFLRNQHVIYTDLKRYFPDREIFNCIVPGFDSKITIFPKVMMDELFGVPSDQLTIPE